MFLTNLDTLINLQMSLIQTPLLTTIFICITNIMSTKILAILSLMLILFLAYKKRYKKVPLVIISIGGARGLELGLKELIQRARPENALIDASSTYSFPSGHATLAIVFFSLLIYLFNNQIKNKILRYSFITGNILLIFLIGFSRIYLNVHWFSDVVAGFVLGILWLIFVIFLYSKATRK